jgi:hypothetical protein
MPKLESWKRLYIGNCLRDYRNNGNKSQEQRPLPWLYDLSLVQILFCLLAGLTPGTKPPCLAAYREILLLNITMV